MYTYIQPVHNLYISVQVCYGCASVVLAAWVRIMGIVARRDRRNLLKLHPCYAGKRQLGGIPDSY